jgi:PKHD-type hydroxylase
MQVVIKSLLDAEALARIDALIAAGDFLDGRVTSSVSGKRNLQLDDDAAAAREAGEIVRTRLEHSPPFQRLAHPKRILPPLFSRYDAGMSYPQHVDSAVIDGCRVDVATTVFLRDPESYGGGELVVDTGNGLRRFKLAAGDAIAYPANTLHEVAPVTFGARVAAVTWTQSLVRDPEMRGVLCELATALDDFPEGPGAANLRRAYHNLLRLCAEP